MTIPAIYRDLAVQWGEMGVIPDDYSTREVAAKVCARLLAAYDALNAEIDELDLPTRRQVAGQIALEVTA